MKHLKDAAKSAQNQKLARYSGANNNKDVSRVSKGMPARDGEPKGYARGGVAMAGDADEMPAKARLDRPGRKMPGKAGTGKKPGTNVNVIVMPKGDKAAPPADASGAAGLVPMPPPGAGPAGPPMPPPGAGGPPMPMRKSGGRVGKGYDAGAGGAKGRMEKAKKYGK